MASVAMMVGGVILNAAAFTGGNFLVKYLSDDNGKDALVVKKNGMTKLLKLMKLRMLVTRERAQSFLTGLKPTGKSKHRRNRTSNAFKLYNQAHPDRLMTLPKEPKFSEFYQPSQQQKQGRGTSFRWRQRARPRLRRISFS